MTTKLRKKRTSHSDLTLETLDPSLWNKNRLNGLLSNSRGKKILIIGDVGLDRYTIGSVDRISPEAPVPVVLVREEKLKLGLSANVADNVHVLGGVPLLIGLVGRDRCAEDFRALLRSAGITDRHLVVDPSRRTVLKERVVAERQQLVRIDYETLHPVLPPLQKALLKKFSLLLPKADAVIVEDYAKGLVSEALTQKIFRLANKAGVPVAVDPNINTPFRVYRNATLLTPNTREAENLSGIPIRDLQSLVQAGRKILEQTAAKYVVVTRGMEGMAIFAKNRSTVQLIPTYAREVYDVSGAGDTVISVLMLALISGATLEEASVLGNVAAGLEVGKAGTATVTPDEIRKAMNLLELSS